jgi:hypothetical protein
MVHKKLDQEIFAMFENTRMEAKQSYLGRGRAFEGETTDSLKAGWIAQLEAMADDTPQHNRRLMDDFEAELGLRGIKAPANEAPEVVKRLAARAKVQTNNWSAEEAEEAENGIQRELDKIRPSKADKN